jgi:thiol-disulfide isomerase/thioredoxin
VNKTLALAKRALIPYSIFTLLLLGCAPNPLNPGSSRLKNNAEPLGYMHSGQPLLIGDFAGNPLILYVRSSWCPLCTRLDTILKGEELNKGGSKGVNIITLELIERKILDESGTKHMGYTPGEADMFIPEPTVERKEPLYYYGDSSRVTKLLKLRRIPALIGFNKKGQVAGTLYGFQTDMEKKIGGLIELVKIKQEEIKEKNGF